MAELNRLEDHEPTMPCEHIPEIETDSEEDENTLAKSIIDDIIAETESE